MVTQAWEPETNKNNLSWVCNVRHSRSENVYTAMLQIMSIFAAADDNAPHPITV